MDLERMPGIPRQPRARLEEVPDRVGCDEHDFGILERDRPHVRDLMAVHPRFSTELT